MQRAAGEHEEFFASPPSCIISPIVARKPSYITRGNTSLRMSATLFFELICAVTFHEGLSCLRAGLYEVRLLNRAPRGT